MTDQNSPNNSAENSGKIESIAAYEEALDQIIEQAQQRLRIFDNRLAQGYNTSKRNELLRSFLLANRANRIQIVLHHTDSLERDCPRLLNLRRQFSHAFSIQQTIEEARSIYDPFVIADEAHYLHRFHYDYIRSSLALNDEEGARTLSERFNELWVASAAVATTNLGL